MYHYDRYKKKGSLDLAAYNSSKGPLETVLAHSQHVDNMTVWQKESSLTVACGLKRRDRQKRISSTEKGGVTSPQFTYEFPALLFSGSGFLFEAAVAARSTLTTVDEAVATQKSSLVEADVPLAHR